jgi:accessory gene regulator B
VIKNFFINRGLRLIEGNTNNNYSDTKIEEIRYGLEAIYLTTTKIIFIIVLALFLGIIKEVLLVILFFNILRSTGFGLHAPKSWICWVLSTIFFIGGTYLCKILVLDKEILLATAILGLVLLTLYAPADTKKRPLIKKKKRLVLKILTIIFTISYIIIIFIFNNNLINNILTFSIVLETLLILPISYKILKLPYRNFKNY